METKEVAPNSMVPFLASHEDSPQQHLHHDASETKDQTEDVQVSAGDERDTKQELMEVNLSTLLLHDTILPSAPQLVSLLFL